MDIRAAGKGHLFGIYEHGLFLIDDTDTIFSLSTICDRQISLLRDQDITFSAFDANGEILCLVSKNGLIVFLEPGSDKETTTISEIVLGDEPKSAKKNLHVWYNTMRVIWSDGRIVPVRSAIEDQFRFSSRDCPFSNDGLILVPFQLVFDKTFAIVRVQPPESTSCLVRLAYRVHDGKERIPTRQALMHADWLYVYDMGIIDMKMRNGIVVLLTHTCAVELFIDDHDPAPIAMSLPRDRIDVIFTDEYIKFSQCYRRYCNFLTTKLKLEPLLEVERPLFPPEWEVLFHGRGVDRYLAGQYVVLQEKLRPRLKSALRDVMQVVADTRVESTTSGEQMIAAVMDFGDTRPSYACPWIEVAVTDSMLYLNTFNGVFVCLNEWTRLISAKTGQPVYAVNIYTSGKHLYVQEEDDQPWRKFDAVGNETVYDFTCALLFATDKQLMTRDFVVDDEPANSSDPLFSRTKRCYQIDH